MQKTTTSSTEPRKGFRDEIVKDTVTNPIDNIQNRSQFEDPEILHVALSVTQDGMSYNSNTVLSCADSRIPNLYILSRTSSEGIFDIDSETAITSCIEFLHIIVMKSDRE